MYNICVSTQIRDAYVKYKSSDTCIFFFALFLITKNILRVIICLFLIIAHTCTLYNKNEALV